MLKKTVLLICLVLVFGLCGSSLGEGPGCACMGDMTGDSWLSPTDISSLISKLLPHKDNAYWLEAPDGSCGDLNGDGWLSPADVSALVSILIPHKDNSYWVPCE